MVQAEETLEFSSTTGPQDGTTVIFQGTGLIIITLLKKHKGGSVFRIEHGICFWSIIKLIAYCTVILHSGKHPLAVLQGQEIIQTEQERHTRVCWSSPE